MKRALVSFALALLCGSTARAEPVRWEPGNPTTSELPGEVQAAEPGSVTDGVYGRFDGDLVLALGGGAELDRDGERGALKLSLHYFSMIGLYVSYADRLGGAGSERVLATGVDVRPAFIPRWSRNMQQGPGMIDLMIDSISLGLGAFWAQPDGFDFGDTRGFELSGGFGLPLFGRAPGPWLEARAIGRWPEPNASETPSGEFVGLVLLSWHLFATSPWAPAD